MKLKELSEAALTPKEIAEKFISERRFERCKVSDTGVVSSGYGIVLTPKRKYHSTILNFPKLKKLPCTFDLVKGSFNADSNDLITLEGFPTNVGGYLRFSDNPKLTSFKGLNKVSVEGNLYMESTGIKSLVGMGDHFDLIDGNVYASWSKITAGGIALLAIKGIKRLIVADPGSKLPKWAKIINDELMGERNIFQCQQNLIEAGFEEYAEL